MPEAAQPGTRRRPSPSSPADAPVQRAARSPGKRPLTARLASSAANERTAALPATGGEQRAHTDPWLDTAMRPDLHGAPVQRMASGNAQAVVQRSENDNPDDFIAWISAQPEYTSCISDIAGQCAPTAKSLGEFLGPRGFAIRYRGLLVFSPDSLGGNLNHFVLVVTVAGTDIVLDPTQGQFQGGGAQVAREPAWLGRMATVQASVLSRTEEKLVWRPCAMKYQDFMSFDEANAYSKDRRVAYEAAAGTPIGAWPLPDSGAPSGGKKDKGGCTIM